LGYENASSNKVRSAEIEALADYNKSLVELIVVTFQTKLVDHGNPYGMARLNRPHKARRRMNILPSKF
jgi:hypothetical protein